MWALEVFDDGTGPALYAGGAFPAAGGAPVSGIARWNGSSWSGLAGGANDSVLSLGLFDEGEGPLLFAGGGFTSIGGKFIGGGIARWNGAGWSALGGGVEGAVWTMTVFDDGGGGGPALYVGGDFITAGGATVNRVAKWDGSSWSALGSGVSSWVFALEVFDDGTGPALYAGGLFTSAGGVPANHVARWDGSSWSAVGPGVNGSIVSVLEVFDAGAGSELYAGGDFTLAGKLPASRIARWNGASWLPGGPGMNGNVAALEVFDDGTGTGPALYAGGAFTFAGEFPAARIARWDGSSWTPLAGPGGAGSGMNSNVFSLKAFDDGSGADLYAGGRFATSTGGDSYVARWGCPEPPLTFFCTAKSALVCGPADIGASGRPSSNAASGFVVAAQPVRGCRAGLLLYSNQPLHPAVSFGGPGDGLLCLSPGGLRRAGPIESGGTSPQACDGILAIDVNEFNAGGWTATGCNPAPGQTNPAGFLASIGTTVHAQMWGRDSITTGQVLTGGITWMVGP